MFGSTILEVFIGIIFIFFLVSVICSAVREGIEGWMKTRAAYLEQGIRELLKDKDGKGIVKSFYEHPIVYSLYSGEYKPGKITSQPRILARGGVLPSYIPSKNFALTLLDIAARGPSTDALSSDPQSPSISLDTVRMNIENIRSPYVQRALLTAIDTAQGDLNRAQENIERWYDSAMDRVSGWYKRSTQWILFLIGLSVAIIFNINTLVIADYLSKNDTARKVLVAEAENTIKNPNGMDTSYTQAKAQLESLNLPIGWGSHRPWTTTKFENLWSDFFLIFLGWLLTAIAATMGAPFWFDLLNKVMVIRSTVKPHEKSQEEASEDRQLKQSRAQTVLLTGDAAATVNQKDPVKQTTPTFPTATAPNIRDVDSDEDGCTQKMQIASTDITTDEQLPRAEGGVA